MLENEFIPAALLRPFPPRPGFQLFVDEELLRRVIREELINYFDEGKDVLAPPARDEEKIDVSSLVYNPAKQVYSQVGETPFDTFVKALYANHRREFTHPLSEPFPPFSEEEETLS